MVMIAYLGHVSPFKDTFVNKMEIINELTALVATYPLLAFTGIFEGSYTKGSKMVGWVIVSLICLSIVFNILIALVQMVWKSVHRCKLYSIRRRNMIELRQKLARKAL